MVQARIALSFHRQSVVQTKARLTWAYMAIAPEAQSHMILCFSCETLMSLTGCISVVVRNLPAHVVRTRNDLDKNCCSPGQRAVQVNVI
jgi:hypothetical protein